MTIPGWIKAHRIASACVAGALVLAIGGGVTWAALASQSPEVAVTVPSESPKPTSKPSTTPPPKTITTTKPSPTAPTAPEEKPKEQPRTDEPKTQNPDSNNKPQPPAPKPPAPQPPPAPEPPPPPEPEPEPEAPRGDANAELSSRYGTNYNGVTRCGNANSGSATSAASLPQWSGVGNIGWSVWSEGDRWYVQYFSCE